MNAFFTSYLVKTVLPEWVDAASRATVYRNFILAAKVGGVSSLGELLGLDPDLDQALAEVAANTKVFDFIKDVDHADPHQLCTPDQRAAVEHIYVLRALLQDFIVAVGGDLCFPVEGHPTWCAVKAQKLLSQVPVPEADK